MERISLDNNLELGFEILPQAIRLVVFKNDEELVCRKEKLKKLFKFTDTEEKHLFKGRLQLFKSEHKVNIKVKNEFIATVLKEDFMKALNKLK